MDAQTFDRMTKALASGTSRRSILQGMVGGALAALGLRPASGQAAKVGICHQTGSATNPVTYITVSANAVATHEAHGDLVACPGAGYIDPATCTCACSLECEGNFELDSESCTCVCNEVCDGNYVLDEGTCSCVCPVDEIVCGDGETFNPETCACELGPNPECAGATCSTFVACDSTNPDCVCTTLFNGGGLCVPGSTSCVSLAACSADGGCPDGSLCAVNTCCGTPVCIPVDLECSGSGATFRSFSSDGPTIGGR